MSALKQILGKINKVIDIVIISGAVCSAVIILGIMLMVSAEMMLRYFFDQSILGNVELTEYGLLWCTMFGSAWVLKKGGHINIDVLTMVLRPRTQKSVRIVVLVCSAAAVVPIVWYGFAETYNAYVEEEYMFSILELDKWIILVAIPIGFSLLIVQLLKNALQQFRERKGRSNTTTVHYKVTS